MKNINKKYRFFYHYYRQYNCMSVHWKGQCHKVRDVVCEVPTETKWSDKQPRLKLQGFATEVTFNGDIAYIK